jgi:hypothetical protein
MRKPPGIKTLSLIREGLFYGLASARKSTRDISDPTLDTIKMKERGVSTVSKDWDSHRRTPTTFPVASYAIASTQIVLAVPEPFNRTRPETWAVRPEESTLVRVLSNITGK